MSKLKDVRTLTITAMLVAVAVILGFFKIPITSFIEIRFSELPIALAGALFGPGIGALVGILADIGGFIVKPTGSFFPGFTISAAVAGIIFGKIFYQKELGIKRILIAQFLYTVIISLVLNSINLAILYGNTFWALLTVRFTKEVVMYPINVILLALVLKPLSKTSFVKRSVMIHE